MGNGLTLVWLNGVPIAALADGESCDDLIEAAIAAANAEGHDA